MAKISACLVIRNEGDILKRCLDSIEGVVDEIIIIHDGDCSDNTLDIASSYDTKIFVKNFSGAMETYLPFAYKKAKGDWILRIDADEYLSNDLRNNLRKLAGDNSVSGYEFRWPIWGGNGYLTKNWPYKLCFFRKRDIHFLGILHFITQVSGKVERSTFLLEHKPNYYNLSWESFKKKWSRWAKIHAQTYLSDFSEIEKFNYRGTDWPLKIKLRVKFPIVLMPFEFFITFFKDLKNGAWKEGKVGIRMAFMYGLYRIILNYYIFKLKLTKK